jgi:hypothetical protein
MLAIDAPSAAAVRRIFAEYLDGSRDRVIAKGLNRESYLMPVARRPDQNRDRLADSWQGGTPQSNLDNPRCIG